MTTTTSHLRGQHVSASSMNANNLVLSVPGMQVPAVFGVEYPSTLYVAKHAGVFGNGVTHVESSTISLDTDKFFARGSDAYTGTVLYRIDPQLYMKPKLVIESGFITQEHDPDVLVLGWVQYPGSSAALASNQFIPAQTKDLFRYYGYKTAKDLFREIAITSSPATPDLWYAAVDAGSGSPTYTAYLAVNGGVNTSTSPLVSVVSVDGEEWLMIKNQIGQSDLQFTLKAGFGNPDAWAVSAHTRLYLDAGVLVTTGIQFRGTTTPLSVSTGTVSSGTGSLRGSFTFSLMDMMPSTAYETVTLVYTATVPAGKSVGFAASGIGNKTVFEQVFVSD